MENYIEQKYILSQNADLFENNDGTLFFRLYLGDKDEKKIASHLSLCFESDEANRYDIFIESFLTIIPYRQRGYGKFLFKNAEVSVKYYIEKYKLDVKKIYGNLVKSDKKFWHISFDLYNQFALYVFENDFKCLINGRKVNPNNKRKLKHLFNKTDYVDFAFYRE